MNIRKRFPNNGASKGRTPEVLTEIERIAGMWSDCRARNRGQGPFLFGHFSIADAMYAPVVLRFRTYEVELPPACRAYADTILALPALKDWIAAAVTETESLPQFELYG